MIVRLGKKSKSGKVESYCEKILEIEGTEKKQTPQRCIIKLKSKDLTSAGMDGDQLVIDFRPSKADYPEAHGSSFCKPHTNNLLAKEGWIQAHPQSDSQLDQIVSWVKASAE